MKSLLVILVTGLMLSTQAAVDSASEKKQVQAETNLKKKKSTEVNFDDVLVQGRYNFSDELVTTVEEDKVLDALLAVPKDFSERVKVSKEQH